MSTLNVRRVLFAVTAATIAGCSTPPPPPRVAVPRSPEDSGPVKTYPQLRPLREPTVQEMVPPPAFDDAPLITQAVPEEPAYVNAYNRVGKPRVAVFVNRTIEGQIIPVDERKTIAGVEVTRDANAAIDVQSSDSSRGWYGQHRSDSFKTQGPARLHETAEVYLAPGQYDDVQAKAIDYQAIELVLADVLSAGGKVTLVSPMMARQRLTDDEVKDLQSGRPTMLREIAEKLDVDVLIQAQARPTKQTADGLEVRILVEAINTRGGESVARAFVDVPPPLEKTQINKYARFLARKTMAGMANAWTTMASEPPAARTSAMPPTTQPR
jgi:hypothetical protein